MLDFFRLSLGLKLEVSEMPLKIFAKTASGLGTDSSCNVRKLIS